MKKKNPFRVIEQALSVALPEKVEISRSTFIDALILLFGVTELRLIKGDPEHLWACRVLNELGHDADKIVDFSALMKSAADPDEAN